MNNLYREEILEHYKDPLNFGKLEKFDFHSKQLNPFCGDEIEMFVKLSRHPELDSGSQKDSGQARMTSEVIEDIRFSGKGCAISIAASSMLTEFAKGKKLSELTKFTDQDMLGLINVEISETRKKCALLGLAVLKDCIK